MTEMALPDKAILKIGLKLSPADLFNLCLVNRRFNSLISGNLVFWQNYPQDEAMTDVFAFGTNTFGQLGTGDYEDRLTPTRLPGIKALSAIAGANHSAVIDLERKVWTFGLNINGQLGLDDRKQRLIPTQIRGIRAKKVSLGGHHTLLIGMKQSKALGFGETSRGQLGIHPDHAISKTLPTQLLDFRVSAVSAGISNAHTVIIRSEDASVWTFGDNRFGQLGLGLSAAFWHRPTQVTLKESKPLCARIISAGEKHTIVVDLKGRIWVFGDNEYGQLGLGDYQSRNIPTLLPLDIHVKDVSAGGGHTVVVDTEGEVWIWGSNRSGQLGLGNQTDQPSPVRLPRIRAKSISAGKSHTMLIDFEGNVWGFGWNRFGQLGLSDIENRHLPTKIPRLRARVVSAGLEHSIVVGAKYL